VKPTPTIARPQCTPTPNPIRSASSPRSAAVDGGGKSPLPVGQTQMRQVEQRRRPRKPMRDGNQSCGSHPARTNQAVGMGDRKSLQPGFLPRAHPPCRHDQHQRGKEAEDEAVADLGQNTVLRNDCRFTARHSGSG